MKVLLAGATGYIGSAIATALQTTIACDSWALTDAQQMMGALADALVLDRQFSAAKARQVLAWQPQAPSLFDELKEGTYAVG
jgi:UDP-glucose 4-epimerase